MPYTPGTASFSEPTLLSILALLSFEENKLAQPLVSWVLENRNKDGSIGLNHDFANEGLWNTPLLAITMHHLGFVKDRDAAIDFLIGVHSLTTSPPPENNLNTRRVGWPWVTHMFGWVEPTSWALLALSITGKGNHPRAIEARAFLEDRCIPQEGWNYGNKAVFDRALMPFWDTTALALLALGENSRIPTDTLLNKLVESLPAVHSLYSNALVSMCLDRFGRDSGEPRRRLTALLHEPEKTTLNLAHTALASIALSQNRVLTP